MEKILNKLEKYILYTTVFLLPVTVLSISSNPFVVPKLALLVYGLLAILLVRCLRIVVSGKFEMSVSKFDFPVLLIAAAYITSTILKTPNKMEALLLPGTATAVVGGALLYFLINQLTKDDKKNLSLILFASGVFYSFVTLISFTGIFVKMTFLPAIIRSEGFTPEGGYLPAFIFLVSMLPFGVGHFFIEKQLSKKAFLGAASLFIGLGIAISLYNILPGQKFAPKFPSSSTSWSIAVDSLKTSPILGIGPGNYLTAFNRYRPIEYNSTELWAVKFTSARNFVFTLMTEAGLLATAGLVLLLFVFYKTAKKDLKEQKLVNWGVAAMSDLISISILTISLFIFPSTTLLTIVFFILLAFYSKGKHTSLDLTAKGSTDQNTNMNEAATRFPAFLVTLPIIIGVFYTAFNSSKMIAAEYKFMQSISALAKNNAQETYDIMREAIKTNPYVDRYHSAFARINLALANSIASKAQTGSENITDQDRSTITTLVQQAIAEAKSSVSLNPTRSGNWEILAQTYQAIIPLAQGSDNFAIQSYRQAVALDPLNTNLRIALGAIHYAAGDFDSATNIFEMAVATKPDHANARYNYAFALSEIGKVDRAISEMTTTLSLITDKEGEDFKIAEKALSDMKAQKEASAQAGEELTPPQQAEESLLEPPIELPEGSEPPEGEVNLTPTPVLLGEDEQINISPTPTLIP